MSTTYDLDEAIDTPILEVETYAISEQEKSMQQRINDLKLKALRAVDDMIAAGDLLESTARTYELEEALEMLSTKDKATLILYLDKTIKAVRLIKKAADLNAEDWKAVHKQLSLGAVLK